MSDLPTIESLTQELAAVRAQLEDQLDTSATFQQRNGELESQVLQTRRRSFRRTAPSSSSRRPWPARIRRSRF